jgi:signal transduction histidine kinase
MSVAASRPLPRFWQDRARAAGIHLLISLVIAGLAALLVFGLWYPYPYREIAGGRDLFLLVVTVDVVLGPAITLAIFDRRKPMRELRRDLTVVGLIQLAGLAYGLWTVWLARPVQLVFEFDRFRVVHAVDIPAELVARTPAGLVAMPVLGPGMLAVRPFRDEAEKVEATMLALGGIQPAFRPDLWQPYELATERIRRAAKPLGELRQRLAEQASAIDAGAQMAGRPVTDLAYLPLAGRKSFWTVLLDPTTAQVLAFIPLDPY